MIEADVMRRVPAYVCLHVLCAHWILAVGRNIKLVYKKYEA
jgi:hypothetical protein